MYILVYVKLIWYSGFPEIYAQLEEGGWSQSAIGICAFIYMGNIFAVVVLYVHSSIWETYLL